MASPGAVRATAAPGPTAHARASLPFAETLAQAKTRPHRERTAAPSGERRPCLRLRGLLGRRRLFLVLGGGAVLRGVLLLRGGRIRVGGGADGVEAAVHVQYLAR